MKEIYDRIRIQSLSLDRRLFYTRSLRIDRSSKIHGNVGITDVFSLKFPLIQKVSIFIIKHIRNAFLRTYDVAVNNLLLICLYLWLGITIIDQIRYRCFYSRHL